MSSTKLGVFCDKVLEIGWLLAVIITPLFFNIWSDRVFEPDKLTALRTVALIMAAVWLVKLIEERVSGRRRIELTWHTPLILPTVFMVLVYLLSTALSVTRWVSLFGSYQRLQGTYTTLSYIVIFFIILQELRTREQLDHLITVIILNSLPIALYGFLQHNGLDPLPWGGDVTRRIASNMGNAIFVAAYLIMAALPTLARVVDAFRSILADEDTGIADVLRAAAYIFVFLVQIIAIWYSQSRGPQMGLLAGLGIWMFLGLMALQRAAQRKQPFQPHDLPRDLGRGLLFGLGSLAAAGAAAAIFYFAGKAIAAPGSSIPQWAAMGAAVLVALGIWMVFIVNRRGWRWLWISALLVAILFSAGFLVINLVEPVHEWSKQQPWLGRLDDVLQAEGGTGKVRSLLWEQALALVLPHEPIEFPPTTANPTWRPDRLNFLRPLVGYGPESMFVAANRFYPPLLGHYEKRTSSGDRAHNETMDTLVITGLLGFSAYLWLFGSLFYFGLRWLGFLPDGWRRTVFFVLLTLGPAVTVAAVIAAIGPHFFGLAIPVGMVGGLFLYLIVYSFSLYWEPETVTEPHPHFILLAGVLAAVVAHLIEINFGIAIASTRTTFWAYAGVLVVAGLNLIREHGEEPQGQEAQAAEEGKQSSKRRRKRRRAATARSNLPAWLGPTLAAAIVSGFILGTLTFDFIGTNPERLDQPLAVIWHALTVLPFQDGRASYGMLMIFALTWSMNTVVSMSEMAKRGAFRERKGDSVLATTLYLLVSLAVGLGFALVLAGHLTSLVRTPPQSMGELTRHLALYYGFIVFTLIAGGVALFLGTQRLPRQGARPWGVGALIVLAILAGYTAVETNLNPIRADIVYKQGGYFRQSNQPEMAIQYDQAAIELDPRQDQYYLYLAMDMQKLLWSQEDAAHKELVLREFERVALQAQALNPLATDHSANLARVYQTWWQVSAGQENSQALAELASRYHETATTLSPNNVLLWNQWAQFLITTGNFELAQEKLDRSFELDAEFEETWIIQANLYASQNLITETIGAYEQALEIRPRMTDIWLRLGDAYMYQNLITDGIRAYEQALEVNPRTTDAWLRLGDVHLRQNQWEEAVTAYEQALALKPDHAQAWRVLGSVYAQLGRSGEAIAALQRALELAPEASDAWDTHRLLTIMYSQLGQNETALHHAQMALQLAPENQQPELQALVEQLQLSPEEEQP
jgi:tetratricopeptide (TPR) repeat protein/MFS family permease